VAKIIAGVGCSDVPAIGAALDLSKTEELYWQRVFTGFERSQQWITQLKPDVAILVFNDHATAFSVISSRRSLWGVPMSNRLPMRAGARDRCRSCRVMRNSHRT
jgi:hypothetical protein